MKLSTTTLFYGPRPDGSVGPMLESIRRIHKAGFRDLDLNFAWTRSTVLRQLERMDKGMQGVN